MPEKNIEQEILNKPEKKDGDFESKEKNPEEAPEKSAESLSDSPEKVVDSGLDKSSGEERNYSSAALAQSNPKKQRRKNIEKIMEVDLAEIYMKLSPDKKREFKKKGEETAKSINALFDSAKFKAKKVLALLKDWLKIIPGVNKFFIEQLAKKKLDEIMKIKMGKNEGK